MKMFSPAKCQSPFAELVVCNLRLADGCVCDTNACIYPLQINVVTHAVQQVLDVVFRALNTAPSIAIVLRQSSSVGSGLYQTYLCKCSKLLRLRSETNHAECHSARIWRRVGLSLPAHMSVIGY
jgi:hypothetical protein